MKIYTSSFKDCNSPKGISIDKSMGAPYGFKGTHIEELTPQLSWQEDLKKEECTNIIFYIIYYYETVLKNFILGNIFKYIKEGAVLLTSNDSKDFSHRHILAVFLELLYGITVKEISYLDEKLIVKPRNPYYQIIKDTLEKLLKNDIDMNGFTSIAAAHAHNIALELKENSTLNKKYGITKDDLENLANSLESTKKM